MRMNRPRLTLDTRWNRIRINSTALLMLGNPEYLQLLINPDARKIIIIVGTNNKNAHRVSARKDGSFTMTSKSFITELMEIDVGNSLSNTSFYMLGAFDEKGRFLIYDMNDIFVCQNGGRPNE